MNGVSLATIGILLLVACLIAMLTPAAGPAVHCRTGHRRLPHRSFAQQPRAAAVARTDLQRSPSTTGVRSGASARLAALSRRAAADSHAGIPGSCDRSCRRRRRHALSCRLELDRGRAVRDADCRNRSRLRHRVLPRNALPAAGVDGRRIRKPAERRGRRSGFCGAFRHCRRSIAKCRQRRPGVPLDAWRRCADRACRQQRDPADRRPNQ